MTVFSTTITDVGHNEAARRDAVQRTVRAPQEAFAAHIAVFYPYPTPLAPRSDETLRSDATRGPAATAPHTGLGRQRRGQDPD